MKIVFMGTPDFSVPILESLVKEHEVVCVYSQPPKEAGRGHKILKTPVHIAAEKLQIEVRTPKSLKNADEQAAFADLNADVAVVAAYGLILPKTILEAFPRGCINVHASLLPRWRGAAPIQRAIEAGDGQSGVTIMQMAEGLDTGDMLLKGTVELTAGTTGGKLHDKLSVMGAQLINQVLNNIDSIVPEKQNENDTCYAAKIDKSECKIDFSLSAEMIERKIRAFNPYPAMYFEYAGERFKILEAEAFAENAGLPAGTIIDSDSGLLIQCGEGILSVNQIQRQGKKVMAIEELLRGFKFKS
ncbi:MAG: methionyl-tRNA formyltransferase [Alphaproteobacteria bacterium]|nr:methionyl-tRNA formyltransferase [Alphaproteobacteria bacterium]